MKLKPTYKLFPKPTDLDKKGGWHYPTEYINQIERMSGEWSSGWEEIDSILLSIENLADDQNTGDTE